jgi:hypothetical protein
MQAEHNKKENTFAKWYKQSESEEYWRAFNIAGGVISTVMGLLFLLMAITGGAEIPDHGVTYYIGWVLGITLFAVGFIIGPITLIYYGWRFRAVRDKDKD